MKCLTNAVHTAVNIRVLHVYRRILNNGGFIKHCLYENFVCMYSTIFAFVHLRYLHCCTLYQLHLFVIPFRLCIAKIFA